MNHPVELARIHFHDVDTLVLAGGGNRCWWQAGVIERIMEVGGKLPRELIGTSAGAAVAAACVTGGLAHAMQSCLQLFASNPRLIEWDTACRWRPRFVHDRLYPVWISSLVHQGNLSAIHGSASKVFVAITHPSEMLGLFGTVLLGTFMYAIESLRDNIHPTLPRYLGLKHSFIGLHECANSEEAQTLLVAAATAAPMLTPRKVAERTALDAGYLDNAAMYEQGLAQRQRTLVLLTRHHRGLPRMFRWNDRMYWQPSGTVPVSIWDCTPRTTVRDAFVHGWNDADRALMEGRITIG